MSLVKRRVGLDVREVDGTDEREVLVQISPFVNFVQKRIRRKLALVQIKGFGGRGDSVIVAEGLRTLIQKVFSGEFTGKLKEVHIIGVPECHEAVVVGLDKPEPVDVVELLQIKTESVFNVVFLKLQGTMSGVRYSWPWEKKLNWLTLTEETPTMALVWRVNLDLDMKLKKLSSSAK
jgi:hypothetical protein